MNNPAMLLLPSVMAVIRAEAFRAWRSLHRFGFEPGDISQEIALHWFRRRRHYDPSRASVTTFVSCLARNRCLQLLEGATAAKRGSGAVIVSFSDPIKLDRDGGVDRRVKILDRGSTISADAPNGWPGCRSRTDAELRDLRADVDRIISTLPSHLASLARRLKFETVTEAARSEGISRATANRYVVAIRDAFTHAGIGRYIRREPIWGGRDFRRSA